MLTGSDMKNREKLNGEELMTKILSKRILGVKRWIWLIIMILLLIFGYFYLNYCRYIEETEKLTHTVIDKVFEVGYESGDSPTREQVLQIIYGVFSDLGLEDFKEPKDAEGIISWAQNCGVLKGRLDGLCLDQAATKQESLVFIGRSLSIKESDGVMALDADKWSMPQIVGLLTQEQLEDINELGNLREIISVSELEGLLDQIIKFRTQYRFLEFIRPYVSENAGISAFVVVFSGLFINLLSNAIIAIIDKKRKTGTIYLAGVSGVGKSTLMKQLKAPGTMRCELIDVKPTVKSVKDGIEIRTGSGDLIFKGSIIDVPGDTQEAILWDMIDSDTKNKILLLVLAHTKASGPNKSSRDFPPKWLNLNGFFNGFRRIARSDKEIDENLLEDQLDSIRYWWGPIIQSRGERFNKIVVFLNKKDLVSKKIALETSIYDKHMELLYRAVRKMKKGKDGFIRVVEGSSITKENLDELQALLRPDPPRSDYSETTLIN